MLEAAKTYRWFVSWTKTCLLTLWIFSNWGVILGIWPQKCYNKSHFPTYYLLLHPAVHACYFFQSRVGMKNKHLSHTHQHAISTDILFSRACYDNRGEYFGNEVWYNRQSPVPVWSQLSNRTACCLCVKRKLELHCKNTKVQTTVNVKVITFCAVGCWGTKTSVPTVRCSRTSAKTALELLWHSWCLPFHVSKPS